jgi:hypothetical protein
MSLEKRRTSSLVFCIAGGINLGRKKKEEMKVRAGEFL